MIFKNKVKGLTIFGRFFGEHIKKNAFLAEDASAKRGGG